MAAFLRKVFNLPTTRKTTDKTSQATVSKPAPSANEFHNIPFADGVEDFPLTVGTDSLSLRPTQSAVATPDPQGQSCK